MSDLNEELNELADRDSPAWHFIFDLVVLCSWAKAALGDDREMAESDLGKCLRAVLAWYGVPDCELEDFRCDICERYKSGVAETANEALAGAT